MRIREFQNGLLAIAGFCAALGAVGVWAKAATDAKATATAAVQSSLSFMFHSLGQEMPDHRN
jgi:hypothetical protein